MSSADKPGFWFALFPAYRRRLTILELDAIVPSVGNILVPSIRFKRAVFGILPILTGTVISPIGNQTGFEP